MNTPETNKLLEDLLAEIGTLGRHNCPEKLVTFCRKLERERDEVREQNAKLREIAERAINAVSNQPTEYFLRAELEKLKEGEK
jgi:hypothetical protein